MDKKHKNDRVGIGRHCCVFLFLLSDGCFPAAAAAAAVWGSKATLQWCVSACNNTGEKLDEEKERT